MEAVAFRAEFLGRSLERELVGGLEGPRSSEAHAQLREIAQRRQVRIQELIRRVSAHPWWTFGESQPTSSLTTPPERIFAVEECPVCMGSECHQVLACGHVVCEECIDQLRRREARGDGGCHCPQCRQYSRHRWTLVGTPA